MFLPYFNFKENPFNLTIDLSYLYLGHQHEEAIAHLTYALSEGEGFIVITGQRGTGKTMVCRNFLEQLDANVETAYIDRSTSNPRKLLLDINTEFKIHSATNTIKDLADDLNEFLIQKKLDGKKVVVFIDDAHKLKADVLEQVRLISNLETSKDKLLQLVLIGEPQLSEMLYSNELRQIGQRVSVGYCIGPLTYDETVGYIQHRLTIASKGPPIRFDQKAVRQIFKYSGGNPRKINQVCNQSLAIAYQQQNKYIDRKIAKEAESYLYERDPKGQTKPGKRKLFVFITAGACLFCAITLAGYFLISKDQQNLSGGVNTHGSTLNPAVGIEAPAVSGPPTPVNPDSPDITEDRSTGPFQAGPTRESVEPYGPADDTPIPEKEVSAKMIHSVQVGAFSEIENAKALVARLNVGGHSARIAEITDSRGRRWYLVLIGDHATLEAAEEQAKTFAQSENMKTFLRPYVAPQTQDRITP